MLSLENKKWKNFKIDTLFEVDKGIYLKQNLIIQGNVPYITAKAVSNGLNEFIGNKTLFNKNSITVEKVNLTAFYQPKDYYCSHDVSVLKNEFLNKENSLFICSMINRQGYKYSYGRQAQMNVIKRETLFCPINEANKPDYKYMEEYTKLLIDKKLEDYKKYAKKMLSNLEYKEIEPLEKKKWMSFKIYDIFSYQRGKRQIEANRKKGNIPYYSASQIYIGLTDFISNPTFMIETNAIIYSTFGDAYYVEKGFSTRDEITILTNNKLNKFNGLFIINSINQNKSKYSFDLKINCLEEQLLLH